MKTMVEEDFLQKYLMYEKKVEQLEKALDKACEIIQHNVDEWEEDGSHPFTMIIDDIVILEVKYSGDVKEWLLNANND